MKVVLIGSGNVATVLGKLIKQAGHTIVQVYSRDRAHAAALAALVGGQAIDSLAALDTGADIYIMAVSDTALLSLAPALQLRRGILVHTSGAGDISLLAGSAAAYGVLYPLQSIRKETAHLPVIPFLTEGSTPAVTQTITAFAQTLSPLVQVTNAADRLRLHLAAILSSNFTNHLYALAAAYCEKESLDFNLLIPLIRETANRLQHYPAAATQTGPAIRNDVVTMEKHLALLEGDPALQELYRLLSESIRRFYHLK